MESVKVTLIGVSVIACLLAIAASVSFYYWCTHRGQSSAQPKIIPYSRQESIEMAHVASSEVHASAVGSFLAMSSMLAADRMLVQSQGEEIAMLCAELAALQGTDQSASREEDGDDIDPTHSVGDLRRELDESHAENLSLKSELSASRDEVRSLKVQLEVAKQSIDNLVVEHAHSLSSKHSGSSESLQVEMMQQPQRGSQHCLNGRSSWSGDSSSPSTSLSNVAVEQKQSQDKQGSQGR